MNPTATPSPLAARTRGTATRAIGSLGAVVLLTAGFALSSCTASESAEVTVAEQWQFTVDVADTPQLREQGLSGRGELPPATGMLFVYDDPAPRNFWMVDMRFPIDLAWIRDGRVAQVETLQPCPDRDACPLHPSPGAVDQVLEVPAGALDGVPAEAMVTIG